jgi:O-antigen/teichoic acid export membrane protein
MAGAATTRTREPGAAERTAERAAKNTAVRAVAELVGKCSTLLVMAVLARQTGASGLGTYVFALAWAELATLPVGMGIDRYLLRQVARDRKSLDGLFFNVLWLKASRFAGVFAVSVVLVNVLGFGAQTREAVYALSVAAFLQSTARTLFAVFNGLEHGGLVAVTLIVQRVSAAVLGIAALALGHGTVGVAWMQAAGGALGAAAGLALLQSRLGLPRMHLPPAARRDARRRGLGFAVQDLFGVLIARVDAVLLSLMATAAVVGIYGAAYRLLESTMFLALAVTGAFSAMFTYLDHHTEPTIGAVYARSVKLCMTVLVPCASAFIVLAEPLCRLLFGAGFAAAAGPLRLLAPVVVLLGLVYITTSLLLARREPWVMRRATGLALAVNLVANLALIPAFGAQGAAAAMLLTELVFAALLLGIAARIVGRPSWRATFGSPLLGGVAMALPMASFASSLPVALIAGALTYAAVFVVAESWIAPLDLRFVGAMVRARLPVRD